MISGYCKRFSVRCGKNVATCTPQTNREAVYTKFLWFNKLFGQARCQLEHCSARSGPKKGCLARIMSHFRFSTCEPYYMLISITYHLMLIPTVPRLHESCHWAPSGTATTKNNISYREVPGPLHNHIFDQ